MGKGLTYEQLMASIQADRVRSKEEYERMKASFAETDRKMRETDKIVRRVSKQLGYMSSRNGAAAENYFYNSFKKSKEFGDEKFDDVDRNVRGRDRGLYDEYDIVLYNGKSIGIIEVKHSAASEDIAQTLKKAVTFRQVFPQYNDFTIYLGLASFVFDEKVEKSALDAGLAVVKQVGKTMVVEDGRMKKF